MNSGGDGVPLWLHGRQQGRWSQTDKTQWLNRVQSSFAYKPTSNWSFNAAVELDYEPLDSEVYFHTIHMEAHYQFLSLRVGRHIFNPLLEDSNQGNGSYLFGDNYRPILRITAGIPIYTPLPLFFRRIEVRGEISHGKLDDHYQEWSHKNELLHEKYAYLRVNLGKVKPYVGVSHSAILGGYDDDGQPIPVDYWKSFVAKSSEKIGGGDALNAAGAHMGLYDFGAYFSSSSKGDFHIYYQAPFSDASGMRLLVRNIDQIFGVNWTLPKRSFLTNITLEWIHTAHQSGNGMPDFTDGQGLSFTAPQLREMDLDEFMLTNFGQTKDTPYNLKEVFRYLEDAYNHGNPFGGRDGYMSNGSYPSGWTYYGDIMGSPLNLIQHQLRHKNPKLGTDTGNLIVNDRYKAIHLGASGRMNSFLEWNLKATFSRNYGSYYQQYPGRYTWDKTEDYFFEEGLRQTYFMIGAKWNSKRLSFLHISTDLGLDVGEIFNSYGAKVGLNYTF